MRSVLPLMLLLAGCSTVPPPQAGEYPILHYLRTNSDGSEPEHVVHYRPTRETISVYKWVSKCTTAAYVTAQMNPEVREAIQYRAGKVGRDGTQQSFGTLSIDDKGPALLIELDPPGSDHISRRHPLNSRPFIIFDFDFADLNSILQEQRPRSGFTFALPVIWPDEPTLVRDLGTLKATYMRDEVRLDRATRRFDLRVEGPKPAIGSLWVDSAQGFIVEAQLGLPNHAEYRDFRLRLEKVEAGGQTAWNALTASQYAGCPAGN